MKKFWEKGPEISACVENSKENKDLLDRYISWFFNSKDPSCKVLSTIAVTQSSGFFESAFDNEKFEIYRLLPLLSFCKQQTGCKTIVSSSEFIKITKHSIVFWLNDVKTG